MSRLGLQVDSDGEGEGGGGEGGGGSGEGGGFAIFSAPVLGHGWPDEFWTRTRDQALEVFGLGSGSGAGLSWFRPGASGGLVRRKWREVGEGWAIEKVSGFRSRGQASGAAAAARGRPRAEVRCSRRCY